ncbi:unnamed protein product [Triticum turgidum subsp. durum]|uniref:Uncharacterized protein n=1 Tax=Triticum turgidum subsp. durum TaxID=4567 RepID=A0A9R1RTV5_TRITD|nr:unnamed protein product [Triticum turgidum subsp. durum]VAI82377.1 unnamed protein product [Triticum turgidum subsp. durum]
MCDKCERWKHQICALFNFKRGDSKEAKCTCPKVLFLGLKICQGPCLAIIYKNNSLNRSGKRDTNRPFMMGKALMRLVLPHQIHRILLLS